LIVRSKRSTQISFIKYAGTLTLLVLILAAIILGGYYALGARASYAVTPAGGSSSDHSLGEKQLPAGPISFNRPVLAFYYSWYTPKTWCSCTMSDLPTIKYNSDNNAHHTQKIWAAGVLPGYNDTKVPGRKGTYIVPRKDGATERTSWNAAIASHPDWITITSFNEWFEGSMLEPSVTYGNLYINLTGQLAWQWRK
jgi:hypothetical protein